MPIDIPDALASCCFSSIVIIYPRKLWWPLMCGRFALVTNVEKIRYQFGAVGNLPSLEPHFNIPPGQPIIMLYQAENLQLTAALISWGLIPWYEREVKLSRGLANARRETVAEKPAFKQAFKKRRGLVLMSGFYEWRREASLKQPFYFTRDDDQLLTIAAIWEERVTDDGVLLKTSALLTTDANALMAPVHDRMPVIIREEDQAGWLDNRSYHPGFLAPLLQPQDVAHLSRYPVTSKMNNARFDEPDAIVPLKDITC